MTFSAVCAVSILSYNDSDSSFNSSSVGEPQNILSYFGSYSSDLFVQILGYFGAFILLSLIFKIGFRLANGKDFKPGKIILGIFAAFISTFFIYKLFRQVAYSGALGYIMYACLSDALENVTNKDLIINSVFAFFSLSLILSLVCVFGFGLSVENPGFLNKIKLIFKCKSKKKNDKVNFTRRTTKIDINLAEPIQDTQKSTKKSKNIETHKVNNEVQEFILPSTELLKKEEHVKNTVSNKELESSADKLISVLKDFGIDGEITSVSPGPVVTLYELKPAAGIKSARVIGLASDIARYMSAISARVSVVPGKNALGIELPNKNRQTVYLRSLLESDSYTSNTKALPIILGKSIGGDPIVADLAKMPHLLIAGTTGSGKSVGINSMIVSLLYKLPPSKCKFIMVDPKMLELSVYDEIPHLLTPVVTDPKKAVMALKWAVKEMENRYISMAKIGVRNIEGYNAKINEMLKNGKSPSRKVQTGFDPETGMPIYEEQPLDSEELPYIVIVVDEMADLMLVAGKEIEVAIQRLAQMARAAGIHLIMATQRPSVDVITGTIKANFPTRISFLVSSKIDSRTILGEQGAEQLLGQGDMLYMASGGRLVRVHGPFVSDSEVEDIVNYLKSQGEPKYVGGILEDDAFSADESGENGGSDPLYKDAVDLILREGKVSTSFLQRHLQIGYNRAARIVDIMEKNGIISPANHVGKREILK